MGLARREDIDFAGMAPDRQANVEIVSSAYASIPGHKAYLTMPVTTGRRYYEVLDRHGVRTVAELEAGRPGALRDEVILPNIEEANALAERVLGRTALPLVVPGVFEARKQRWGQEEYMCLWMRLITGRVREVHLSDGWEYSNGGAAEFARAILIRHRALEGRDGEAVDVILRITPGEPVRVATRNVELAGEAQADPALQRRLQRLRPRVGDVFHHGVYEEAKANMDRALAERGYFDARQARHEVKVERMQRLVEVIQRNAHERAQRFVGRTMEVLIEGPSRTDPSRLRGRTTHNKAVNFEGIGEPGTFTQVEISGATSQTLTGTQSLVDLALLG